jgi:thiopeptide-type bacteriocin biosynthesis protein
VGPLVRELAALASLDAVYFDRVSKPDWAVRIRLLGGDPRLHGEARAQVAQRLEAAGQPFAFVDEEAENTWVGGPAEGRFLMRLHHLDSRACLELLDIEGRAELATSRAQWSLLIVERLLDLFEIRGAERLEFYRRGFQWAQDLGRWDSGVFAALERKFEAQAAALRAAIGAGSGNDSPEAWGGAAAARIATQFLEASRGPVGAICRAVETRQLGNALIDMALLMAHAHSNRLGIHATQEATIRYLAFRTREGEGPRG